MASSRSIALSITIKATPREVFKALTDSKSIRRWSGQRARVEPTIGGRFEMFDGWVKGKVLAYENGKVLSYTWHPADWNAETPSSIVRYKFSKSGRNTKVSLAHTGFPNAASKKEHQAGWKEHVFSPLKDFFESRKR